jgi:hypothetical protein
MANLKGGTTIGGQLALNTNGLALTGGTMKVIHLYLVFISQDMVLILIGCDPTNWWKRYTWYIRTNLIASVVTTDGNLHIDAGSTKATYLNFYSGTGGTLFGNGAGVLSVSVNNAGDMVLKKIKLLWVLLVVYSLVVVVILQIM